MEDHDHTLVIGQRGHQPEDLVPVEDLPERITRFGAPERRLQRDETYSSSAPEPIPAPVDEDPVEPGLEPLRIPQPVQARPGALEGVAHRVLGLGGVGEQEPRDPIGAIHLVRRERDEAIRSVGRRLEPQCRLPHPRPIDHEQRDHRALPDEWRDETVLRGWERADGRSAPAKEPLRRKGYARTAQASISTL